MADCGYVGAPQIHRVMAKGEGKTRWSYMAELIAARLTGQRPETFESWEMQRGTELEPEAVAIYEFERGVKTESPGFIKHPSIPWAGATPDRVVLGTNGLAQFKCPNISTHLDTLLGKTIQRPYVLQCQFEMASAQKEWNDWSSYDPRLPEEMQLFTKRIYRDDVMISEIEKAVREFLDELHAKLDDLKSKYGLEAAA